VAYNWLAEMSWLIEGAAQGKRAYEEAIEFAARRGLAAWVMGNKAEFLRVQFDLGEWDQIIAQAGELLRWGEAHDNGQIEAGALRAKAEVLLQRGRREDVGALQSRLLSLARRIEQLQVLIPALAVSAVIEQARGEIERAVGFIDELDQSTRDLAPWRAHHLPTVVRILVGAGEVSRAEHFMKGMDVVFLRDRNCLLTGQALVAEAKHEHERAVELYDDAAQRWAGYGFALEHGQALLGNARCSLALARSGDALPQLHRAREIFTKFEAQPLIEEVDTQLQRATALTS